MAIKHEIVLSTTEPNSEIGLLKIRQSDEETQELIVTITENGVPKSYEGYQAFFCAKLGQTAGLGIIEQKLNSNEMTKPAQGELKYTMRAEDWQQLGRQTAYFSFRKMKNAHEWTEQFSTRDFNYTVIKNVFSEGLTEVKKDGSTYVWTIEDLIRLFNEYIASGKTDWEEFVEQNREIIESVDPGGVVLTELITARGGFNNVNERFNLQIGATADFREFENNLAYMKRVLNENAERAVNPLWFGAIGDGVTDDGLAIKACHEYANLRNYNVIYPTNRKFYFKEVSKIPVLTSVDFNNAELIFDESTTNVSDTEPIFEFPANIYSEHTNDSLVDAIKNKFKKGVKNIPELSFKDGQKFVEIYDDNDLIFARYGVPADTAPRARCDIFRIDDHGNLLDDLMYNFNGLTRVVIHNIPPRITVKNTKIETLGSVSVSGLYLERNIRVLRSNVIVENIEHTVINDNKNLKRSRGIIHTRNCCDIYIKDSKFPPRLTDGSYELSNFMTLNITYDNVDADSDENEKWGAHVGYLMKNLRVANGSKFNRIDSHLPSMNIEISSGSTIGRKGLTVCGFGLLKIDNIISKAARMVSLRDDYGAFWSGEMEISKVEFIPAIKEPSLLYAKPILGHDFGVVPVLAKKISMRDIIVRDDNDLDKMEIISIVGTEEVTNPVNEFYKFPNNLTIENIKVSTGKGVLPIRIDQFKNIRSYNTGQYSEYNSIPSITPNVQIEFRDIKLLEVAEFVDGTHPAVGNLFYPLRSAEYGYNTTKDYTPRHLIPEFTIDNCENVRASLMGLASIINATNSTVKTIVNFFNGGSMCKDTYINCEIEPKTTKNITSPIIRTSISRTKFLGCTFKLPITEDGKVPTTNSKFLTIYEMFSNITNKNNIRINTRMTACDFEENFNFNPFNSDLRDFGVEENSDIVGGWMLRKKGPTANRPFANAARPGTVYYDTTLSKLVVFDGTNWV